METDVKSMPRFLANPEILGIMWVALGILALANDIIGYYAWQALGGVFAKDAWTVWGIGIVGGMVAVLSGIALRYYRRRFTLLVVRGVCIVFALYFLAYLVFGGEGTFWARVLMPIGALWLCYQTFRTTTFP